MFAAAHGRERVEGIARQRQRRSGFKPTEADRHAFATRWKPRVYVIDLLSPQQPPNRPDSSTHLRRLPPPNHESGQ